MSHISFEQVYCRAASERCNMEYVFGGCEQPMLGKLLHWLGVHDAENQACELLRAEKPDSRQYDVLVSGCQVMCFVNTLEADKTIEMEWTMSLERLSKSECAEIARMACVCAELFFEACLVTTEDSQRDNSRWKEVVEQKHGIVGWSAASIIYLRRVP